MFSKYNILSAAGYKIFAPYIIHNLNGIKNSIYHNSGLVTIFNKYSKFINDSVFIPFTHSIGTNYNKGFTCLYRSYGPCIQTLDSLIINLRLDSVDFNIRFNQSYQVIDHIINIAKYNDVKNIIIVTTGTCQEYEYELMLKILRRKMRLCLDRKYVNLNLHKRTQYGIFVEGIPNIHIIFNNPNESVISVDL